ncbi:MAG: YbaK/EbsC family protein [Myxococcota bacterium]
MSIATRLKWFLDSRGAHYELIPHSHSASMLEAAQAAQVPGERVAKSVLLEDERGYMMAVLPASHRIRIRELTEQLDRTLELATEPELEQLFRDCEVGAVPPLGAAYGLPTVVDDSLLNTPDVYFEAGDHEDLVHLSGVEFLSLLAGSRHGRFSRHA